MLMLKVLLLTIIMTTKLNLIKKFTLDAIIFCIKEHPLPYYGYLASLFYVQVGIKSIMKENLVD